MEKDRLAVGREYIERARTRGKSDQDIKEALLRAGWTQADLGTLLQSIPTHVGAAPEPGPPHEAPADPVSFVRTEIERWDAEGLVPPHLAQRLQAQYEGPRRPAPAVPDEDASPRIRVPLTPGMVLLYVGGLLILIAGVMLVTPVWSDLGNGVRFALVLLPTLALYGAGVGVHLTHPDRRVAAVVMLFFACVLVPFALLQGAVWLRGEAFAGAMMSPLHVVAAAKWVLLVVAMTTFAVHVASLYFFRSPLLSILYPSTFVWLALQAATVAAPGPYGLDPSAIQATLILSGLVLLAVGTFHAWQGEPAYAVMPDLVGSFCLLAGLVVLGADGHHAGWELLAFLASAGLIAASVYRKNLAYLAMGALFLTITIFWIGFEYFGETAGLPVTLLMCGALSMTAGYLLHHLRNEHAVRPRRSSAAVASGSGRRR